MHRIDTTTADNGAFVDPIPAQGVSGTVVDASWLNGVQNELCNTIEDAGISLDKNNDRQLVTALKYFVQGACQKYAVEGIYTSTAVEIDTTEQRVGAEVDIPFDHSGWYLSLSIFVNVIGAAQGGNVTVKVIVTEEGTEHTVFTTSVPADEERNWTVPLAASIVYKGKLKVDVVASSASNYCTADVIVQGTMSNV